MSSLRRLLARGLVIDADAQIADGLVVLVVLEHGLQVLSRVAGVEEVREAEIANDLDRGLEHRELVVGVAGRQHQEDAFLPAEDELREGHAIAAAAVSDVQHGRRIVAAVMITRGLLQLPEPWAQRELLVLDSETEEAEHEERRKHAEGNSIKFGIFTPEPHEEQNPAQPDRDGARQAVQQTDAEALDPLWQEIRIVVGVLAEQALRVVRRK
mmetsp:Transcript_7705/g.19076  ORF Transcript_7705/g.19076 Transcript_7705/m.19076 type:complete len:212 (+) Transcript_7705:563-1198(+)